MPILARIKLRFYKYESEDVLVFSARNTQHALSIWTAKIKMEAVLNQQAFGVKYPQLIIDFPTQINYDFKQPFRRKHLSINMLVLTFSWC